MFSLVNSQWESSCHRSRVVWVTGGEVREGRLECEDAEGVWTDDWVLLAKSGM